MATRDNSGTIGPNDRKNKDTHPDLKGQATIDGVEYWVSGWNKSNERGPFTSLAFEKKQNQRAPSAPPPSRDPWD